MNEQAALLKAKIACKGTGIEVQRTVCGVCSTGCSVDAYVKDGRVVKVEGTKNRDFGTGQLCAKGYANREYIYRRDRIKSPLRRIGERGRGEFEPITWEQAYSEIAKRFNGYKRDFGADSVAFFSGYCKWYRPILHRLAHSFGTLNYGSESSACFLSTLMASMLSGGCYSRPDMDHAGVLLIWSCNQYNSMNLTEHPVLKQKERGMKVVAIDPRITSTTQKIADIHLRILPGTDGALAHGLASIFIKAGWIDKDYIEKHVHGYEEYAAYVEQFDVDKVSEITGLTGEEITDAAQMIMDNGPMAQQEGNAAIIHHKNGMQNYRAIDALSAITGHYDRKGGQLPTGFRYFDPTLPTGAQTKRFLDEVRPKNTLPKIGTDRFPLWSELIDEFQAMDMAHHILEQKPYPLKALFAMGLNVRMFPNDAELFKALETIDFYVDVDMFMTDSAKYADLVLPACSSFERSELRGKGAALFYTNPAIEPLYESKSDVDIICELAEALELNDELLRSGYESCCDYLISGTPFTIGDLKNSAIPLRIPAGKPNKAGSYTSSGYFTPSGKYELKSTIIEKYSAWGLKPLPEYVSSVDDADKEEYPFILSSGSRISNAFHSRLHGVSWTRALRPDPAADIHPEDAKALKIKQGDDMELTTSNGTITVKANITLSVLKGMINMLHGYSEADVNSIIVPDHFDPYSGFPGYRTVRCTVRRQKND